MSELQSIADATIIKFLIVVVGGCVGFINAIGFFILGRIKTTTDKLWLRSNIDHDRINTLETEHKLFHPESGIK